MRRIEGAAFARETVLKRTLLSEKPVPPSVLQRIREIFEEDLTPDGAVARILADVAAQGDAAVVDYTRRIDGFHALELRIEPEEIRAAYGEVAPELVEALRVAAGRVRDFHERARRPTWLDFSGGGNGLIVRPLDRVGIYVPGGTAAYPSTVLMTAIPARVAGVAEVYVATPPGVGGRVSPAVLVAADIAGVDGVFRIGGAQGIGALAYGTETVPRVDKILGPGNLFVTLAKRRVFGLVDIDALQGPTETLIIADGTADARLCAADLLAQAEHDILASPLMITTSAALADRVDRAVEEQLAGLSRQEIAREALAENGAIIVVESLDEAFDLANGYAPEHLCLLLEDPWQYVGRVRHSGGIFVGERTAEVLGDYVAGPSHVMPTGGSARFSSPLGLDDFLKTSAVVYLDERTLREVGPAAATIARAEGFTAHAAAVEMRLRSAERGTRSAE
jgi:histidinol dehydrogenase